jgi:hypothetical protein
LRTFPTRGRCGGCRSGQSTSPCYEADLAEVAAQQEAERAAPVAPEAAPLDERLREHAEVVLGENDVYGLARHLGAVPAHGHADVREPEGGGVIDAVAGHRDGMAATLEALDDPELVDRGDAGDDGRLVQSAIELLGLELGDLGTCEHRLAVAGETGSPGGAPRVKQTVPGPPRSPAARGS